MGVGLSGRSFASLLGVTEGAVRKADKAGRIVRLPDGSIDAEASTSLWSANADPARTKVRSGAHGAQGSAVPQVPDALIAEMGHKAQVASTLIRELLRVEGHDISPDKPIDFDLAKTAEKVIQVYQRKQDHDIKAKLLLDADEVTRSWANRTAMFRARMQAIPSDVAFECHHFTKHDISVVDRLIRDALQSVFDEVETEAG